MRRPSWLGQPTAYLGPDGNTPSPDTKAKTLADAWDEGHNHCFHVEDPADHTGNPYR